MSQVPVKWVYEGDLWDDADEEEYRTVPVVELSALREVVEGLRANISKSFLNTDEISAYRLACEHFLALLGDGEK